MDRNAQRILVVLRGQVVLSEAVVGNTKVAMRDKLPSLICNLQVLSMELHSGLKEAAKLLRLHFPRPDRGLLWIAALAHNNVVDADAVERYNDDAPRLGPLLRGISRFNQVTDFEQELWNFDSGQA